MDGKTIKGKLSEVLPNLRLAPTRDVKSQESHKERDADGKKYKQEAPNKKLTEEEVQKAIAIIKELPGFKKNNLKIRTELKNSFYIVYIEDQFNKVIRRIEESELCQLLDLSPTKKGKIFNKSA